LSWCISTIFDNYTKTIKPIFNNACIADHLQQKQVLVTFWKWCTIRKQLHDLDTMVRLQHWYSFSVY